MKSSVRIRLGLLAVCAALLGTTSVAVAQSSTLTAANTTRLSFGTFSGATQANAAVANPKFSRDGRFVVFESTATNLVDTSTGKFSGFTNINGTNRQIYLYDRQADSLEIVSIREDLTNAAPMDCHDPVVSSDGRYVAYIATTNGSQAEQMNTGIDGDVSNGNACLYSTQCHVNYWIDGTHIWVRDRLANKTFLASQATIPVRRQKRVNGVLQTTTDKRQAAFGANCDIHDDSGVDATIPVTEVVNLRVAQGILIARSPLDFDPASAANPNIGGDGRYLVFDSNSDFLGGIIDAEIPEPNCNTEYNTTASTGIVDSSYIGMPTKYYRDGNGTVRDVFVHDASTHTTDLASFGCKYFSPAGCILQGNLDAIKGAVSDDGSVISWQSASGNLLSLDFNVANDIFFTKRSTINGEIEDMFRVSNATNRIVAANGASTNSSLSGDGRYLAFQSAGTNLVSGDTNSADDIFVYDTKFFTTIRCVNSSGVQGDANSRNATIGASGETVGFESASTNFGATSGVTNGFIGELTKDSSGRLTGCKAVLATPGTGGTGVNSAVSKMGVAIVPVTDSTTGVRKRVPAVAFLTAASNASSLVTDSNGTADVFEAPVCQGTDATTDSDGDGTTDCFDQCWKDPLKVVDDDSDADGIPDCEDGCKTDAQKAAPGQCGCGIADIDSDGDGAYDCSDSCPNDAAKTAAGSCGCGIPDTDANSNGVADCVETTNPTPVASTPTVSPTQTPVPDFDEVTLPTPELRRLSNSVLGATLFSQGVSYNELSKFEVQIRKTVGRTVTNTTKFFSKRSNAIQISKLSKGSYRIRVRGVSVNNTKTLWSRLSNAVVLR